MQPGQHGPNRHWEQKQNQEHKESPADSICAPSQSHRSRMTAVNSQTSKTNGPPPKIKAPSRPLNPLMSLAKYTEDLLKNRRPRKGKLKKK